MLAVDFGLNACCLSKTSTRPTPSTIFVNECLPWVAEVGSNSAGRFLTESWYSGKKLDSTWTWGGEGCVEPPMPNSHLVYEKRFPQISHNVNKNHPSGNLAHSRRRPFYIICGWKTCTSSDRSGEGKGAALFDRLAGDSTVWSLRFFLFFFFSPSIQRKTKGVSVNGCS